MYNVYNVYNVHNVYNIQLVLHCLPSPWSDNVTCREHSSVDGKIFETCTATAIMDLWVGWGTGYCSLGTGHWTRCTVFSMSWGPHGPEPALWGANNGMHTTLHNVQ